MAQCSSYNGNVSVTLRLLLSQRCWWQDMQTFLDTMSTGTQNATSEVPFLGAVLHVQRKEFAAAEGEASPTQKTRQHASARVPFPGAASEVT